MSSGPTYVRHTVNIYFAFFKHENEEGSKMSSIRNDVCNMLAAAVLSEMKKRKKCPFLSLVFLNCIIVNHQINLSNKLDNFTFKVE